MEKITFLLIFVALTAFISIALKLITKTKILAPLPEPKTKIQRIFYPVASAIIFIFSAVVTFIAYKLLVP